MEMQQQKPLWHGVVLVAGGAVGAGMFALPLVAAGAWFAGSIITLVCVWSITYLAARLLIEVNMEFAVGSSFDTIVRGVLGARWAMINNASIAFIMFILMYAYITAGGGILAQSLAFDMTLPRTQLSMVFALGVATIIYFGTSIVSRISTVLMLGMGLSFVTANAALSGSLDWPSLSFRGANIGELKYLGAAFPVFVTAFACAGLVPSLLRHYPNNKRRIKASIFYGSAIALLIYIVWLSTTLGNIPRAEFSKVAENGGGLVALVGALGEATQSSDIDAALRWFSHLAVITSFLSIALGLAHFLSDRFNFADDKLGRLKAVLTSFLPPVAMSAIAPYGFVTAIGYAGVFVAFSFFIVPALMHARRFAICGDGQVRRRRAWPYVFIFGLLVIILKLGLIFSILPTYP